MNRRKKENIYLNESLLSGAAISSFDLEIIESQEIQWLSTKNQQSISNDIPPNS